MLALGSYNLRCFLSFVASEVFNQFDMRLKNIADNFANNFANKRNHLNNPN